MSTKDLSFLPLTTGAACLDGSPYGYYFVPSTTGSKSWTISLEGGGWCWDETSCYGRSHGILGNSSLFPAQHGCACMNVIDGHIDSDCNCIYLPYCDGASFSGYRAEPWPVPSSPGATLTFRGLRNLDATMDEAFAKHGMEAATEMVLTGGSAGGLATFLHADHVAARMGDKVRTTAAPVVGYFLDHAPYSTSAPPATIAGYPRTPYGDWMRYITSMQNLTADTLLPACLAAFPATPHWCFMAPHMSRFIETPLFMFNSKVDAWQMLNDLQLPCIAGDQPQTKGNVTCDAREQAALVQYGDDFLSAFAPVQAKAQNGAFITSCICHGCPWPDLALENRTSYELYAAWYEDTAVESASHVHVDAGPPNGGGALQKQFPTYCLPFP